MTTFRFQAEVRKHVRALTELMEFANAQDQPGGLGGKWCWQTGGVYGAAHDGVMRIVAEVCGQQVADRIDGFNFGGDGTWFDSVESAVDEAMREIEEEERVECEKDENAARCQEV